jgi:hypothetical protein
MQYSPSDSNTYGVVEADVGLRRCGGVLARDGVVFDM